MTTLASFRGLVRNSVCRFADGLIDSSGRQTLLGVGSTTLGFWASILGHGRPVEIDPNIIVPQLPKGGSLVLWATGTLPTGLEEFGTGRTLAVPACVGATVQVTETTQGQKSARRSYLRVDSIDYSTGVVTLSYRYVLEAVVVHSASVGGVYISPRTTDVASTLSVYIIGILWSGPGVFPLVGGTTDYLTKVGTEYVMARHDTQWITDALTPIIDSMEDPLVTKATRKAALRDYLEQRPNSLPSGYPRYLRDGVLVSGVADQLDALYRGEVFYQPAGNAISRRVTVVGAPGVGVCSRVYELAQGAEGGPSVPDPWIGAGWNFPFASHPWRPTTVANFESGSYPSVEDAVVTTQSRWRQWKRPLIRHPVTGENGGTEASPVYSFVNGSSEISLTEPKIDAPPTTYAFDRFCSPFNYAVERTSTTAYVEAAQACLSLTPLDMP